MKFAVLTFVLWCLCVLPPAISQKRNYNQPNLDAINVDYIKSVKFYIEGLFLSVPILELGSNSQLILEFDDLDGDAKDYFYSITHCDKNWIPSDLSSLEYIEGFAEERLNEFDFSFKTLGNYTHYVLAIPNREMSWKLSGNYLLQIHDRDQDMLTVLTRRFMVVESTVGIQPRMVVPNVVSKSRTHQEIDFNVDLKQTNIRNPRIEVFATVLQNGRWDNAIMDIPPMFTRPDQLIFDHQDKIVFAAGKEFRFLDLRSLRFRNDKISTIERDLNTHRVVLFKESKRFNQVFFTYDDLNGKFIIESNDQRNGDLTGNYADVLFALDAPAELPDQDIYLFGALTDWRILPEFQMVYNNAVNAYVGTAKLKQGYYDYCYVNVPKNTDPPVPEFTEIEGNSFETQNNYTILIYYRPFGERYDRLIGAATFQVN